MSGCMGGDKIHNALRSLSRISIHPDDLIKLKIEGTPEKNKKTPTKHDICNFALCEEWKQGVARWGKLKIAWASVLASVA